METNKILRRKWFLYLTEFFAGASVMAIELGAQRLLSPYFSSSQIVWTIVIGTIMIAMALGNIYGGRTADKDPSPDRLYSRLLISAVWIALIPALGKYLIAGVSAVLILAVNTGFLIVASTVSCLILFVFPLFLLGTTSPCLVKYCTKSLDESGKTVGSLNAFNTIGSIIGTFLPTFVTIPTVGTNMTFLIFAFILIAISSAYFLSEKKFTFKLCVAFLALVLGCVFGYKSNFAFWEEGNIYQGESQYNYLKVYETDYAVGLSTNVLFGVQSVKFKTDGVHTGYYYDYDLGAYYMTSGNKKEKVKVLVLGMGSGTYATELSGFYDNVEIVGVEIDGKITEIAREYFELSDDITVHNYDGRAFLNVTEDKYDIIMVDAYQDITIPFQMSSVEFFTKVKGRLTEDGVMVVNLNMRSDEAGNINYYLCDTIAKAFKNVYTFDVGNTTNRELFAFDSDDALEKFKDNLDGETNVTLKKFLKTSVLEKLTEYEAGNLILTDDKAPVELLGINVIDKLIIGEAEYYRNIFREKGLKGLLEQLS